MIVVALLIGGVGGYALRVALSAGVGWGIGTALFVLMAAWPLGWIATIRIVRPLQDLARVAGELRGGKLDERTRLPRSDAAADDEVGEVAGALRGMADRVARQLADQRALMAAVSHELRSPLARVRVLIELLREGTAPATAHDDVQAEIDGMDALVGDLLAAARIDFEALALRPLPPPTSRTAPPRSRACPPRWSASRGNPDAVHADATLMARALSGLLDNARRYGAQEITLTVSARDDRVRFQVDDDGPGLGEGDPDRIFAPFWRGPDPGRAPDADGVGLGLALVRQIAVAHGGLAAARNRPDRGATVWLEIPIFYAARPVVVPAPKDPP